MILQLHFQLIIKLVDAKYFIIPKTLHLYTYVMTFKSFLTLMEMISFGHTHKPKVDTQKLIMT